MCPSLSWIAKSIARRVRWDWQSAENSANLLWRRAFTSTVIPTGHSHGCARRFFPFGNCHLSAVTSLAISFLKMDFEMYISNDFFEYLAHKNTKAAKIATALK
jgi:hypothetical protein